MSESLPTEKKTKVIETFGWSTKIDDDRGVYVGFRKDDEANGFALAFHNKEFKNYLLLSDEAAFALHASLEKAIEYRRTSGQLREKIFKVSADVEPAEGVMHGHWSVVTEDKESE